MTMTQHDACRWAALLLAAVLAACVGGGCSESPTESMPADEVVLTSFSPETPDGWTIELKRYRLEEPSADGTGEDRLPVILCHGLSCNNFFWDLTEKVSFAHYLAEEGYDVWVPSLRGSGKSTKPGFYVIREVFQLKLPDSDQVIHLPTIAEPDKFDWNFDDYVREDLPTIIDMVKRATGHSRVVWVGHSMGGMVMYAYLVSSQRSDVAALVTIGSPIYIPQPPNDVYRMSIENRDLFRIGRAVVNAQVPAGVGAVTGRLPMEHVRCNRENMDTETLRSFYRNCVEDVPNGLIEQLLTVARTGYLSSADEKCNYTAQLSRVRVPILCLAGKADNMCEPACVRYAYEHVGSTDKTYRELALVNGFTADYGHLDLILGKKARKEVFPYIRDWLSTHDRP